MIPIFYIKDGNLSFADKHILSDIELQVAPYDRICLVGRNGSGKSSLMKIITGEYELDTGDLFKDPSINIGYLKQDVANIPSISIYDYILQDYHEEKDSKKYQADIILQQLQIDGTQILSSCSGGGVRRALLAKALVANPEILLLDEPTNHLDITAIEWLEQYLQSYTGAVICISHDRKFQENISNKVWWIDRGVLRKSSTGFRHYDDWREKIIQIEEATLRKMNRKLEEEQKWLGTGVTARRKRNQKRLANLHSLRQEYREHQSHVRNAKAKLELELSQDVKKTKFIIEAQGLSYSINGRKLIDQLDFEVKKGEKIGIIGANGSGKSTLVRLLIKEIEPDEGKIKHGTNLQITYFDQYRTSLNPNHSLKEIICPGGGDQVFLQGGAYLHVAAYLKKFMFDPKSLNDKVATLSGGQCNRLLLAKSLINPGNLFILDEPTNDLDMDSLEILLELLADYQGTLIVVSHDRDFLERLVTRTIVFANDEIVDCYGGYEDYVNHYQKTEHTKSKKLESKKPENKKQNNNAIKNASAADLPAAAPRKLSYKYVRLLESLPGEINDIENKIQDIENKLSNPDLYSKAPDEFARLSDYLLATQKELDEKMMLWLEVEEMNNNINNT